METPAELSPMKLARSHPGKCAPACHGQMCGTNDNGVAVFATDKYHAIAESCEEVFMESTCAQGSTVQKLVLDREEHTIECRYRSKII